MAALDRLISERVKLPQNSYQLLCKTLASPYGFNQKRDMLMLKQVFSTAGKHASYNLIIQQLQNLGQLKQSINNYKQFQDAIYQNSDDVERLVSEARLRLPMTRFEEQLSLYQELTRHVHKITSQLQKEDNLSVVEETEGNKFLEAAVRSRMAQQTIISIPAPAEPSPQLSAKKEFLHQIKQEKIMQSKLLSSTAQDEEVLNQPPLAKTEDLTVQALAESKKPTTLRESKQQIHEFLQRQPEPELRASVVKMPPEQNDLNNVTMKQLPQNNITPQPMVTSPIVKPLAQPPVEGPPDDLPVLEQPVTDGSAPQKKKKKKSTVVENAVIEAPPEEPPQLEPPNELSETSEKKKKKKHKSEAPPPPVVEEKIVEKVEELQPAESDEKKKRKKKKHAGDESIEAMKLE